MLSIAKRTAVGAGLLLIMPVAVWVSGWSWQPGHNVWWLKSLYWVTETVTQPWGDYHSCCALRMVSVVSAFSSESCGNAVCDPGRGNFSRSGCEVLG